MIFSRSRPGLAVSLAVHVGLLLAALVLFKDAEKFEDAQEALPVEVISDSKLAQMMKGEKTAREVKTAPRAEKIAEKTETRPNPALAEAKKDVPAPPPPLKRLPDPGKDDAPPTPPKRAAAVPPPPTPPNRPEPAKAEPPKPEPRPAPTPPAKPQAKAAPEPEQEEPEDAEVVKPKPPVREKPKETAKETPQPPEKPKVAEKPVEKPKPEKPKPEKVKLEQSKPEQSKPERLKVDEVAKLLEQKKDAEASSEDAKPEKPTKRASKPKSGDENAPKSKFSAANIANLLSREAPQQQASTAHERTQVASLGTAEGHAPKLSESMQARIGAYIIDHYRPCWASSLSLGARSYQPIVEFHLTREGALVGAPHLINPPSDSVDRARADQALQAVRKCSPIHMPAEFAPFYDFWRDTKLRMTEEM